MFAMDDVKRIAIKAAQKEMGRAASYSSHSGITYMKDGNKSDFQHADAVRCVFTCLASL